MRRFLKGSPFAQPLALALAVALASLGAPRSARAQNVPQYAYGSFALAAHTATTIPITGGMLSGACAYLITNDTGAAVYIGFDGSVTNAGGHYGYFIPATIGSTLSLTVTYQGGATDPVLNFYSVAGTGGVKALFYMAWC